MARTRRRVARMDLAIAGLVLAVVGMMIVPLPRPLLDLLLALNLGIAVVLLMAAVFVREPLRFASFPTILVVTTLFRVGLEVSTTRLVLGDGDAGEVVRAFGSSVVAGSLVVGLVVFAVITIVQLLVVARGAERVAEVAARFALDAMPGRQVAIDADLRAGVIDAERARARRAELTRESQLYGAMDGAMRFVKGDAIAAILIVVINLVGGLVVGIGYRGMSAADAVATYSLLSIGLGLVAQIPSLLVAVASGLLVTRVASAGDDGDPDAVAARAFGRPAVLAGAAIVLAGLALVPGLPMIPFGVMAVIAGGLAAWRWNRPGPDDVEPVMRAAASPARLAVRLGAELDRAVGRDALAPVLADVRTRLRDRLGVPWPAIAAGGVDPALGERELAIVIGGAPTGWATLPGAIDATAIGEAVETALARLAPDVIGVDDVHAMVEAAAGERPVVVREVVPRRIELAPLTELVRALLREQVPVRDLAGVLEAVATAPADAKGDRLVDHVRTALRRQISGAWAPRGQLEVYTIDGMIEDAVRGAIDRRDGGAVLALEPALARDIVGAVKSRVGAGRAVILASGDVRRHLRALLEAELPELAVLAPHELAPGTSVRSAGVIEV
jgi:type III secretion protein V